MPFTSSWTFTANCDDCVRLWVNGQLLFDKWGQQSGVEWVGTLDLVAGQKYGVVMEYYENTGDARAMLYWNSSLLADSLPAQADHSAGRLLPAAAGRQESRAGQWCGRCAADADSAVDRRRQSR